MGVFFTERVMAVAPITLENMKERIRRACTEITPQMLAEVITICIPITNATQHFWSCKQVLRYRVISKLIFSSYLNTFHKLNF